MDKETISLIIDQYERQIKSAPCDFWIAKNTDFNYHLYSPPMDRWSFRKIYRGPFSFHTAIIHKESPVYVHGDLAIIFSKDVFALYRYQGGSFSVSPYFESHPFHMYSNWFFRFTKNYRRLKKLEQFIKEQHKIKARNDMLQELCKTFPALFDSILLK